MPSFTGAPPGSPTGRTVLVTVQHTHPSRDISETSDETSISRLSQPTPTDATDPQIATKKQAHPGRAKIRKHGEGSCSTVLRHRRLEISTDSCYSNKLCEDCLVKHKTVTRLPKLVILPRFNTLIQFDTSSTLAKHKKSTNRQTATKIHDGSSTCRRTGTSGMLGSRRSTAVSGACAAVAARDPKESVGCGYYEGAYLFPAPRVPWLQRALSDAIRRGVVKLPQSSPDPAHLLSRHS